MQELSYKRCRSAALGFLVVVLATVTACAGPGWSGVLREDDSALGRELGLPLYQWSDPAITPKAVLVAVHGMVMHGASFDTLATRLAEQGFLVVAPDLRGYGRWLCGGGPCPGEPAISYGKSQEDLVRLAQNLHSRYSDLPIFWVGESIGADLALRVASTHSDLADGLVLSNPAIRGHSFILIRCFAHGGPFVANPFHQINVTKVIKSCASEDPRVIQGILDDPLARKHLSAWELISSDQFARATLEHVKDIRPTTPILVIQGSKDRTLKANAVVCLLDRLKSVDQTVRWIPDRGHVLLETSYLEPDLASTVESWLMRCLRLRAGYDSTHGRVERAVQMN